MHTEKSLKTMEENNNKYITVAYELYVKNEEGAMEMSEKAPEEHPFQFISGLGYTLEAFEKNILALQKGQEFDFTLGVDEAYGDFMQEYVLDLPKKTFEVNGKFDTERIAEGLVVPMMDAEGNRMNATIVKVGSDTVTIDLNHPLAGKALNFRGKVVEMRDATIEELQSMLNHMSGEGGCGGCGGNCGGGDCGGGCGGNCGGGCNCEN